MKTAVFGGTFDPVHIAHMKMVKSAIEQFDLDTLVLVPNANPPHKKNGVNTDYLHRYNMVRIAFEGWNRVAISDYESQNDRYYYSLYTMRHFRQVYGEDTRMIIGGDSLLTLHLWYESELFLKENKLIVFTRGSDDAVNKAIDAYLSKGADILKADMPRVDISSTDIRRSLAEGKPLEGALCEGVVDYIRQHKLYGGNI